MKLLLLIPVFFITALATSMPSQAESSPLTGAPASVSVSPASTPSTLTVTAALGVALTFLSLGALRSIVDGDLIKTVNLPAAGATAYTPSIDIGTGPHTDKIEGRIKIPATPDLADDKTITVTFQHSSDDGVSDAFVAIPELSTLVTTGAGGIGHIAAERAVRFPSNTEAYVRCKIDALAAAGDNTDIEAEFTILL